MNAISDRRLLQIKEGLIRIGYSERLIAENYDFIGREGIHRVHLAAFGDIHRHDLSTSCIAVHCLNGENPQAILGWLRFLAAPIAFLITPEEIEIWPVSKEIPAEPKKVISYNQADEYFAQNRLSLVPNKLLDAKQGARQLTFFDIDPNLFPYAREVTKGILVERFEQAVSIAQAKLSQEEKKDELFSRNLTKIAMRLLAARILEDKLWSDNPRAGTAHELLNEAHRHFEEYFEENEIESIGEEIAQLIFEELSGDLTFRSLTNEMLSHFYENAFVTPKIRKKLGIYYTPSEIASNMLNRLPIEDIPPEERFVLDGTCGSGNLLGAVYKRLESLLPTNQSSQKKYRYLRKHIWGIDEDDLASEITQLSLFLRSLPFGDSWNIQSGDFLQIGRDNLPEPISIIVANPPFEEFRSLHGKRQEKATWFLERYLDLLASGGLMGIILPESFLTKSSCESSRNRLLSECELLELWQLPSGVIPKSDAPITILLLRKNKLSKSSVVRIQRVLNRAKDKKRFLKKIKATYSYVLPSQKQWKDNSDNEMVVSPFHEIWERLQNQLNPLDDIADVRNGINPGKEGRNQDLSFHLNIPEDLKLWLHGSGAIESYFIDWRNQEFNCVNYPGNLERPQLDMKSVFESSKVLVNARRTKRNKNNPWWLHAVIDELGCFPNKELHYIFNNEVSLEEMVAVLNSPVANAWIDNLNVGYIKVNTLQTMPFPDFSEEQRQQIIEHVREIMNLKKTWLSSEKSTDDDVGRIRKLIKELDDIVFSAYGLTEEEQQKILELFRGFQRPGREWKDVPFLPDIEDSTSIDGRRWRVTGHVVDIDGEKNMICVWIRGFGDDEPTWIPIPCEMPGWALRLDTAFEADIPYEERYQKNLKNIKLMNFKPLEFGYLSDEELFNHIAKRMKTFEEISDSYE